MPLHPMGEKIRLESAGFVLRTMEPADARLDWGSWLADPTTARLLNTTPRAMSEAERAAYIERFDGRGSHLLGIWAKESETLIGLWAIYVDETHREFVINIIVGAAVDRAKGAQKETSDLIYEHFFNHLGMEAVRCTASESNPKMIEFLLRRRWTHLGSTTKPSAAGAAAITIHAFRLSREDWGARFKDGWREANISDHPQIKTIG